MSESLPGAGGGPRHRVVEACVAVATGIFAIIVIIGSLYAGMDWAPEGPRAGFFPFYIGVLILGASVVNFGYAIVESPLAKLFVEWGQLGRVVAVLIPSAIYVALIPRLGIYMSSIFLIGFFMGWLGKYRWSVAAAVAVVVPLVLFVVFERWFLVPLPKGPIEEFLGF